jgi:hypothetical protein
MRPGHLRPLAGNMFSGETLAQLCELFVLRGRLFANLTLDPSDPVLDSAVREAEAVRPFAHRSSELVRVKPDLSAATDDEAGEIYGAGAVVPYWRLDPKGVLRASYDSGSIQKVIELGLNQSLYPYDLPYGGVNVIFMGKGDVQPWHCDFCSYTLILIAAVPMSGGILQMRHPGASSDLQEHRVDKRGSLVLIRGDSVEHRVSAVESDDAERVSITWGLSVVPNTKSTDPIRRLRYGVG